MECVELTIQSDIRLESTCSKMKEPQRKLLDTVLNLVVPSLHKVAILPDLQQLLVIKDVYPQLEEWSPSLDQEGQHIKEEQEELWFSQIKGRQEELWTSREGEELQGLEEADITKFPFTAVPVKSEREEEKPQSSQLQQSQTDENREAEPLASNSTEQMKTEADGEDCGLSEPARNLLYPPSNPRPTSDDKTLDSSETEDSDDEWMETSEPQSGIYSQNSDVLGQKHFSCSVYGKRFGNDTHLKTHDNSHDNSHK